MREMAETSGESCMPRRRGVLDVRDVRRGRRWQTWRGALAAFAGALALGAGCEGSAMALRAGGDIAGGGASAAAVTCVGDCNNDGAVTVNEILSLTNIALGGADIAICPQGDVNLDRQITVDEIIAAVNSAVNGCPAPPATPTATTTPTSNPTPTNSPTVAATFTPSTAASATPTPTVPQALGPRITYFGLAGQDRVPLPTATPAPDEPAGDPVFSNPPNANGRGFYIVVEAGLGPSGLPPATMTSNSAPAGRPDLQIQADRDLGNGSSLVCDAAPVGPNPTPTVTPGGVPGIDGAVPNHCTGDPEQCISDALNDFGCRFLVVLTSDNAITEPTPGIPRFVNPTPSMRQFAFPEPIGAELALPEGDTLLTVRVRDTAGNLGDPKRIVLRVPTPAL